MDSIFHEKQEGLLCAQHCLNALLQGPYFTPVDLASLAQRMDDEERLRMAESGEDSDDYRRFVQQPSGNMDDSGYFSVQVISSALGVWGLELVPYSSSEPLALQAQTSPEKMSAYICNYRDHWFTIRKLGFQWFNLNSILKEPELITNTYLAIFLAQLQEEGYSIFVVNGILPSCTADEELKILPAVRKPRKPQVSLPVDSSDPDLQRAIRMSLGQDSTEDEDADLRTALELSLQEEGEDPALQRAIALSLPSASAGSAHSHAGSAHPGTGPAHSRPLRTTAQPSASTNYPQPSPSPGCGGGEERGERVGAPVQYQGSTSSLGSAATFRSPAPSSTSFSSVGSTASEQFSPAPHLIPGETVDAEEVRRRRLAYLERKLDSSKS